MRFPHHDGEREPYDTALPEIFPAALRRHSRHRQSSPSSGIGRRAVSSAHQHEPARLQVNSVPHREQARRREGGISNRFVMNRTEPSPRFSCLVHRLREYSSPRDICAPPSEESLEHDPEKWKPVFRKGHAQTKSMIRKSGNRFSEKIVLKQRREIMIRFNQIGS
jgi:hypothetical protein